MTPALAAFGTLARACSCTLALASAPAFAQSAAPIAPASIAATTVAPGCRLETIGGGAVGAVLDGRTFTLDDGRELRLGGIEVPPAETAAGLAAKAALQALIGDANVVLRRLGPGSDRYGRVVAQVFTGGDGRERWLQAELTALGHARVSPRVGERACAAELLRREQAARAAKLGLWDDPVYVMRKAEDPAAVKAERGRFAIVEGKVLSVRESGGTIYVNFGRRWSEDFTVTIAKRLERTFTSAGLEPKKLAGRLVRVRGWIEERGGPWVDATAPEQIELVN